MTSHIFFKFRMSYVHMYLNFFPIKIFGITWQTSLSYSFLINT